MIESLSVVKTKLLSLRAIGSLKTAEGWRLHVGKLSSFYYDLLENRSTIVNKPAFSNRKLIVFFNLYLRINEVCKRSCVVKY